MQAQMAQTAIFAAARKGLQLCLKELLDRGADVNQICKEV
jgi:hypothetical protein